MIDVGDVVGELHEGGQVLQPQLLLVVGVVDLHQLQVLFYELVMDLLELLDDSDLVRVLLIDEDDPDAAGLVDQPV